MTAAGGVGGEGQRGGPHSLPPRLPGCQALPLPWPHHHTHTTTGGATSSTQFRAPMPSPTHPAALLNPIESVATLGSTRQAEQRPSQGEGRGYATGKGDKFLESRRKLRRQAPGRRTRRRRDVASENDGVAWGGAGSPRSNRSGSAWWCAFACGARARVPTSRRRQGRAQTWPSPSSGSYS